MKRWATTDAEALALRVRPDAGCLVWTAGQSGGGYGRMWSPRLRKMVYPHRVAYELAKGPIPAGYDIDHLCRNRLCCEPTHLEAVTRSENILRGFEARRAA